MTEELLLEALRWMMLSRHYDQKLIGLQRQGRLGVFSPVTGQEASVVGSALALDPQTDWIVPQYREAVALVHHGYGLERITANYLGKFDAGRIPDHVRVLPNQTALAAQLPHAVGLAWGISHLDQDGVVLAYTGDGGSSEGDFHESLNLAGVLEAPIVFFLQNNQWAISTPRRIQTRAKAFADRAIGYGITGIQVDGNDVLAVYEVTAEAVQRARAGGGPTLVESVTYRLGFHNTTDNPSKYRDHDEFTRAQQRDPIARVQTYLSGLGLWNQERAVEIHASVEEEVDAAVEKAMGFDQPRPQQVFEHIYVTAPSRFLDQRRRLLREVSAND